MKAWPAFALVAVALLGAGEYWLFGPAREAAHHSALSALHKHLEDAAEQYQKENGHAAPALKDLHLNFTNLDGATPDDLRYFEYQSHGTSYTLVRLSNP